MLKDMSYVLVFINGIVVALLAMYVYQNERRMGEVSAKLDVTGSADRPAFLAYAQTSANLGRVILFEDVATNVGKHFSPSTGVFKVPHNGLYSLGCMIMSAGNHYVHFQWMKNDVVFSNGYAAKTEHANSQTQNMVLYLKKGDRIYIKLMSEGLLHGRRYSYISGYLL